MAHKNALFIWTATVAMAGFLFGFDTVVISGANQPIKDLWNTSPWFHGIFIMSMALWGTVIGALFAGYPTNKLGRKKTLFWIGVLYAVSALGSALAPDPYSFSFFRFIGGLGVGASSVTAPTYISEIAPSFRRGRMVATYQFMIVFGIFVAYFSNYLLEGVGGNIDWRLMLGAEALPAIAYCFMVPSIPNSPRWLVLHNNDENKAREVLRLIQVENVEKAIQDIKLSVQKLEKTRFFTKRLAFPITLAFLLAFFNQLSGINFILYYAPEILERAGLAAKESLLSSISIGAVNLIFTLMGMALIDRMGRRTLMIIGSIGYIIGLGMVAYAFKTEAGSALLLTFILVFIAAHAIGQGAVIWVFISEIFPNKVRAFGQSFGSGTHWVFAALITLLTPVFLDEKQGLLKDDPWIIFAFFAVMMMFQFLFTIFIMPETKGKSLEELEEILSGKPE
ncbi:MAG: sugar porter family MFS transporter [Bacteroidota bacterium]